MRATIRRSPADSRDSERRGASAHAHRHLFRGAHALMLNTVLTGGSGFVFWLVAARLYAPAQVGVDGALISLMMAVSAICQLDLGGIFPRFLPESARPASMILRGYAAAGGFALVVATAAVMIVPHLSTNLSSLGVNRMLAVAWVLGTALWTVFALQDAALTGLRSAHWIPVENGTFGVLKVVGVAMLAFIGAANGIFLAWVIPMALLLVPVNAVIFRRAVRAHLPTHSDGILNRFGRGRFYRFVGLNYLASVFDQGMYAALPLLVVAVLGPTQAGYYLIPLTIAGTVDALAFNMATSLTVEGSFASDRLRDLTLAAARRFVTIILPVTIVIVVAAPLVLLPFGRNYADHGATVLRILAIAGLFRSVYTLNDALCRITGRGTAIAFYAGLRCVLVLVLSLLMANAWGLVGVATAWLVTQVILAAVVAPTTWRILHRPSHAGDADGESLVASPEPPAPAWDGGTHQPFDTDPPAVVTDPRPPSDTGTPA